LNLHRWTHHLLYIRPNIFIRQFFGSLHHYEMYHYEKHSGKHSEKILFPERLVWVTDVYTIFWYILYTVYSVYCMQWIGNIPVVDIARQINVNIGEERSDNLVAERNDQVTPVGRKLRLKWYHPVHVYLQHWT